MVPNRPILVSLPRFETLQLTDRNISQCESLWGDRCDYTPGEFSDLLDRARWLLSTDRARGALFVEQGDRVRGFGLATFVREDIADEYMAAPYPQLGKRILFHQDLAAVALDEDGVGLRNAGRGLVLVVINQF